jgi:hypothetical protein
MLRQSESMEGAMATEPVRQAGSWAQTRRGRGVRGMRGGQEEAIQELVERVRDGLNREKVSRPWRNSSRV